MNPKNRTMLIIAAAVVLVVALAGVAFLVTGGDDDAAPDTGEPVPTYSEEAVQNQMVAVTGEPLPTLELEGADDAAVGMEAPVVEGADFDGTSVTTGGPTEGPTLLVYLAHWCPHCNNEVPEILELYADGGMPDDLNVIGISTAVEVGAPNYPPSDWVTDKGWLWPTMADDEQATAFFANGGKGFPYMVLLDDEGVVLSRISGEHGADELGAWLDANLGVGV